MSISGNKNGFRIRLQAVLAALPAEERFRMSRSMCGVLSGWPAWRSARLAVAFHPMAVEPDLLPVLAAAARSPDSTRIGLVRMPEEGGLLQVHGWSGTDEELEPAGYRQLRQIRAAAPALDLEAWRNPDGPPGLVLVPGLGFTAGGQRLGRGKGWYDRFLAAWPGLLRVGVAFDDQVVDELPVEPWDQRVDCLLTGRGLLMCPRREGAPGLSP